MENKLLNRNQYLFSISLIGLLFFLFGFVTWLNGALIPFLKTACGLSNFLAYFVTFAFYISYFVMALPSSLILKKFGFRNSMTIGLFIMAVGAFLFVPAAFTRSYFLFLSGLFVLGTGLALLQTAVNPYVTILGPIESAAKRISIMGICNKTAGVIAPILLASVALKDVEQLKEQLALQTDQISKNLILDELAQRLIIPYVLMSLFLFLLSLMVRFAKLPEIETEENTKSVSLISDFRTVFRHKHLVAGVIALFFYVGVEVISGDTIIRYGESLSIEMSSAKYYTSLMLIWMVLGYIIGVLLIPRIISQKTALTICAILGLVLSMLAVCVPKDVLLHSSFIDLMTFKPIILTIPLTVLFISMLGLANSLVWPAIWPLALDGLGKQTKTASALLIMAIAGGATLPLLYGKLADFLHNTQQAYWIAVPCYLIILYYSVWGYRKSKTLLK